MGFIQLIIRARNSPCLLLSLRLLLIIPVDPAVVVGAGDDVAANVVGDSILGRKFVTHTQGDHSGFVKPPVDTKKMLCLSIISSYQNINFVLMSTGGLTQPEWSPVGLQKLATLHYYI